jgi:hypothetical protein
LQTAALPLGYRAGRLKLLPRKHLLKHFGGRFLPARLLYSA